MSNPILPKPLSSATHDLGASSVTTARGASSGILASATSGSKTRTWSDIARADATSSAVDDMARRSLGAGGIRPSETSLSCRVPSYGDREAISKRLFIEVRDAWGRGNLGQAQRLFGEIERAAREDLGTPYMFNAYITGARKAGHFTEAQKAYLAATSSFLADAITYASYITAAGNNGRFEEAQKAYLEAMRRDLANTVTYAAYITAAGNNGRFEEAQKAYLEASKRKLVNTVTYTAYITAAGNNGRFEEAQKAYLATPISLADALTYTAYITAAGNNGRFEEAQKAYLEAMRRDLANIVTYAAYITAAGHNGRFEEAQKAYLEATRRDLANIVTYNAYITAAGNNGRFEEAQKAYLEASKRDLLNPVTYNAYITAAGNNGRFEEAHKAYETSIARKKTDMVTFHVIINVYVTEGNIELAKSVFSKQLDSLITAAGILDLHECSYGSGLIAMLLYMERNPLRSSFSVIPGKGFHSKNQLGEFKRLLCEYVRANLPEWDIAEHTDNSGRLRLCKRI